MKVGLIGIGLWGMNYIKTLKNIRDIKLNWISSPNRRIKDVLPGCKFTHDYNDILEDDKIDSIIISTPPRTHYELAKKALSSGKDVLVEKPMTLSSKEALELHNLSLEKSRILMVGHVYLYNPSTNELKKMIESNDLGDLLYFHSNRSSPKPSRLDVSVMWDLAPHDISLINYLAEETPISVSAKGRCFLDSEFENVVNISLDYGNIGGFIHSSWIEPEKTRKTIIVGTKKRVVFDDTSTEKLKIYSADNEKSFYSPFVDKRSPLEFQCLHFLDCFRNRKRPLSDGHNGYVNVKILEYAQESLDTGKEVKIDYS